MCFRKLNLNKPSVWDLVAEDFLPEKISSWTMDADITKAFKGGVPEEGWQGVILFYVPPPDRVIVNLWALYREREFIDALNQHKNDIKHYVEGAGKYWNSQSEVVMEVDAVSQADIYSLGGYSSSFDSLVRQAAEIIHGRQVTPEQLTELEWRTEHLRTHAGPRWLTHDATKRVLARTKPHSEELLRIKQLRPTAATLPAGSCSS
jgi:hypothetical protein